MRLVGLVVALNLVAIAFYFAIAARMDFFSHIGGTLFSSPDSHAYRDVANWLFGGPNPFESQRRPFLFPLLLGLADRLGGETAIWLLNFLCWLGTINLVTLGVWRMTGRGPLAIAVFVLLASNISLIVLSFQALTEPLTALLEAAWVAGLAFASVPPQRARDIAFLILPLTLMTVVRPGNELALALAALLLPIAVWRMSSGRIAAVIAVVASCVPLFIQLALMATANHFLGLSSEGAYQFKDYYASQVYASVNGLPADLIAARAAVDPMGNGHLLAFLLAHPTTAVLTFLSNLHANLTSGSNFIDPSSNPTIASAVRLTNKAYVIAHVVGVPLVAVTLWLKRDLRLAMLTAFLLVLVVLCSLINTQGDRYVEMLLPLWPPAYALAIALLWSEYRRPRSPESIPSTEKDRAPARTGR